MISTRFGDFKLSLKMAILYQFLMVSEVIQKISLKKKYMKQ